MEIKVKKNFTDKETGKLYEKDKVYKVDKSRGEEILKSPYDLAEEVKDESLKKLKKELANEDAINIIEKEENKGTK